VPGGAAARRWRYRACSPRKRPVYTVRIRCYHSGSPMNDPARKKSPALLALESVEVDDEPVTEADAAAMAEARAEAQRGDVQPHAVVKLRASKP